MRLTCTLIVMCLLASQFAPAQTPLRYHDIVFTDVKKEKNLRYADAVDSLPKRIHRFDWYSSTSDSASRRPLVIALHGGGFKFGNKSSDSTPFWARAMAQHGYAVASINYRKSKKKPLSRFEDLADGCFEALRDLQLAIDFFRLHADSLRIDPNKIILAGNSAGGMMALQEVYASKRQFAEFLHRTELPVYDTTLNPNRIIAAVNFWGTIYDTSWVASTAVPLVTISGSRDRVVPPNQPGGPLFGSTVIARCADQKNLPHLYYLYEGFGHELHRHFNPLGGGWAPRKRWRDMAHRTCVFLSTVL